MVEFSAVITLVFSVTCSFRNHSNMLVKTKKITELYILVVYTVIMSGRHFTVIL